MLKSGGGGDEFWVLFTSALAPPYLRLSSALEAEAERSFSNVKKGEEWSRP